MVLSASLVHMRSESYLWFGEDDRSPFNVGTGIELKMVGKARFYVQASQKEFGLSIAIKVLCRIRVLSEVREMPVIGGSGLFRFAPARTYKFHVVTGEATVEDNVYVLSCIIDDADLFPFKAFGIFKI
ncbi:hypothetical protein K2173_006814 [Erythroxylum novogranatense]|uniref:Dirigent protein n=1 Tax=Erythroxylum novogranatense TaxID=1862640 RepID=A0AAV8SZ17_9ROSI|nr:hypothetical protein K2173_006814 [Erythroxylum novogranatense]